MELIEPLRLSFQVNCPVERAFEVWTGRIGRWWPADHTVTGEAGLEIVLETRLGGRIFERTADGVEYEWGEVTIWEPPARLGYRWHLRRDRADATDVEIRFLAAAPRLTRVEIRHTGWERLGADGPEWRSRNRQGWQTLLLHYRAAVASAAP